MTKLIDRPDKLDGCTYLIELDHLKHPLYLTVNSIEVNGTVRPLEVFINTNCPLLIEPMNTLTRLLSAILRTNGDYMFAFEELKDMFASESFFYKGRKYNSLVALLGETLEKHCKEVL